MANVGDITSNLNLNPTGFTGGINKALNDLKNLATGLKKVIPEGIDPLNRKIETLAETLRKNARNPAFTNLIAQAKDLTANVNKTVASLEQLRQKNVGAFNTKLHGSKLQNELNSLSHELISLQTQATTLEKSFQKVGTTSVAPATQQVETLSAAIHKATLEEEQSFQNWIKIKNEINAAKAAATAAAAEMSKLQTAAAGALASAFQQAQVRAQAEQARIQAERAAQAMLIARSTAPTDYYGMAGRITSTGGGIATGLSTSLQRNIQGAVLGGEVFGESPTSKILSLLKAQIGSIVTELSSLGHSTGVTAITEKFDALTQRVQKTRAEIQNLRNTIASTTASPQEKAEATQKLVAGFAPGGRFISEIDAVKNSLKATNAEIEKGLYQQLKKDTKDLVNETKTLSSSTLDLQKKKENLTTAMANEKAMHHAIIGNTRRDIALRKQHSDAYDRYKSELTAVNKEMGVFATGSRRAGMAIKDLIKWQAEWYLSQGIIFGFINAVRTAIGNMVEFEQRLANLKAITNSTTAETKAMGLAARELGMNSRFSALEIADGMTILGQAGLSARETIEAMNAVVALSTSTLSDMSISTDLITTSLRAFEMDASKSAEIANILAAGTNYSKLTMQDLKVAFNYVASAGHQAGLSLEQVVAALGTMRDRGIQASTMATGLRGILGVLIAPTDRFRKEIEKVGLNMKEVSPLYNDFGDILVKLRDHGFSVENAFAGVDKRQAGAIITVIQGADAVTIEYKALGKN